MPENGDVEAGALLSGEVGALFDRMLAAIGLDRTSVYCFPLYPSSPPTGRVSVEVLARLADIARHHLALAKPERVWLLGQATSRALLGMDASVLDKKGQNINHARYSALYRQFAAANAVAVAAAQGSGMGRYAGTLIGGM